MSSSLDEKLICIDETKLLKKILFLKKEFDENFFICNLGSEGEKHINALPRHIPTLKDFGHKKSQKILIPLEIPKDSLWIAYLDYSLGKSKILNYQEKEILEINKREVNDSAKEKYQFYVEKLEQKPESIWPIMGGREVLGSKVIFSHINYRRIKDLLDEKKTSYR